MMTAHKGRSADPRPNEKQHTRRTHSENYLQVCVRDGLMLSWLWLLISSWFWLLSPLLLHWVRMSLASAFLRKLTNLLLFAFFFVSHKLIFLPLGSLLVDPLSIFFLCVPLTVRERFLLNLLHFFTLPFNTKCLFDRNALFLSLLVNLRSTCETSCGASSKLFSTLCLFVFPVNSFMTENILLDHLLPSFSLAANSSLFIPFISS